MLIRVEIGIDARSPTRCCVVPLAAMPKRSVGNDLREDGLIALGVVATDDEGQGSATLPLSPVAVEACKSCSGSAWRRWR